MMSQKSYNVDTDHPYLTDEETKSFKGKGGYTDSWTLFELKKHIFTMNNHNCLR